MIRTRRMSAAVIVVIALAACGGGVHKPVQYVRAVAVSEPPATPPQRVAPPAPIVGISARTFALGLSSAPKPSPTSTSESASAGASYEVIERANRAAAQGPEEASYV